VNDIERERWHAYDDVLGETTACSALPAARMIVGSVISFAMACAC
jgi:hypothetical protein